MIEPADLVDDVRLREVYDIGVRSRSEGRPWFQPAPYDDWLVSVRDVEPEEPHEIYVVLDDCGGVVGTAMLWFPQADNTDKVYADIDVDPAARLRGHGGALVEHALDRARRDGRRYVVVEPKLPGATGSDLPGHPAIRFAAVHGFQVVETEVVRHLELPVDPALLDRLGAEAEAAYGEGYRIETYLGRVPDHLLPGLAELMSLLAVDAPSGDLDYEPETVTPERLTRWYDRETSQGRLRLSTLAVHRDGTVAAQTDLIAHSDPAIRVYQDGTYVHRDHRGHRLGMGVKVANLRRVSTDLPGRPRIVTGNAETNQHMVSINEELGFHIVELAPQLVADLDTV